MLTSFLTDCASSSVLLTVVRTCISLLARSMQATPLVAGLAVGAAAYAGKLAIEMAMKMRAAPRLRNFYKVRRASRGMRGLSGHAAVCGCAALRLQPS